MVDIRRILVMTITIALTFILLQVKLLAKTIIALIKIV